MVAPTDPPTRLDGDESDDDGSEDVNVIVTAATPTSDGGESGPSGSSASGVPSGERLAHVRGRVAPGSVINGKYVVEEVLGKGGMGIVLSARHVTLAERYAIKVLFVDHDAASSDGGDFKRRFLQEARVSASLRGEHVARVFDVGELDEELLYMVMERVEGPSLSRVLKTQGTFPVKTAVEYVAQLCEGLAEAHARGIVHRDIKPMNLHLTTRADGSELIKILDFGIAKLRGEGEKTRTGTLVGSVSHMAPEQLRSSSSVDERADIWSLGVLLHQFLVGKTPFTGSMTTIVKKLLSDEPMPRLREFGDFPVALEAAILRALARDPAARTQTVADFAREILAAAGFADADERADLIAAALGRGRRDSAGGELSSAHAMYVGDAERTGRRARRSRRRAFLVAGLLLVGLGVVIWSRRPDPTVGRGAEPPPATAMVPVAASLPDPPASAPAASASTAAVGEPAPVASAAKHGGGRRPRAQTGGAEEPAMPTPPPVKPPPPADPRPATKPANPFEERQ